MRNFRIIPCLLLKDRGLYKTVKFKSPNYIGDPINTLKLFNDKEVDEVVIFDIQASKMGQGPDFAIIEQLTSECFMPLCYGGGVRHLEDMKKLFFLGVEKISLGKVAFYSPNLIRQAAEVFGSQSIVVCVDVRRNLRGQPVVAPYGKKSSTRVLDYIHQAINMGAGEIIINDIDREGTYQGLDRALLQEIAQQVPIPVIASGGSRNLPDIVQTAIHSGIEAVAVGSLFVYHGGKNSVLINYPTRHEVNTIISSELKT